MGVGPLAAWKHTRLPELGARLKWAAAVSLGAALTLPFAAGWRPMVALGLFLVFCTSPLRASPRGSSAGARAASRPPTTGC